MSAESQDRGSDEAERVLRSQSFPAPHGSLPAADFAQSGSCGTLHEWLESLPVTAFIEHDEEIAAANDLARRFIGTSDSIKVDQVLLGAYPAAGDAGRQRFECLFAPPGGAARMVSGAVQPFPAAGDGARLVLLMEPLEEDAESVAGDDSEQRMRLSGGALRHGVRGHGHHSGRPHPARQS